MTFRTASLVLTLLLPVSTFASETCVKFMEADSEFGRVYSTLVSGSAKDGYFTNIFVPALEKYGEEYMNAYPGGRKSKDDKINLELAATWRNAACPGVSRWDATVYHFWIREVYMDEDARRANACRLLANVDFRHWELPKMDKEDYWYANELRSYADDYLEVFSQWVSPIRRVDREVGLKRVIEFHNSDCSGKHHWTDENFAQWKKVRRK